MRYKGIGILFFMMANILSTNAEGKDLLVPSKTDTVTIDTLSTKNRISLPLPNTLVNKQIDRLVEYARKYIGTPYRRGSKGPNRFIIRKTKCSSVLKQNVLFYKTKRTSVNLFSYPNWHKKAPKKYVFFGAFYCSVFWLSHQKSLTLNKYIIFGFNAILIPLKRRYIIPPESWARHRLYSIMSVYVAL